VGRPPVAMGAAEMSVRLRVTAVVCVRIQRRLSLLGLGWFIQLRRNNSSTAGNLVNWSMATEWRKQ